MSPKPKLSITTNRCQFSTSDGRRCTSLLYPGHTELCHQHLRQQLDGTGQRAPALLGARGEFDDVASDLLADIQNFQSATAINATLGRIFTLLAAGRITQKTAISLAYLCQLMLQSLKNFQQEIKFTTYEKVWVSDLLNVLNSRTPLNEYTLPPAPAEVPTTESLPAPDRVPAAAVGPAPIAPKLQRPAPQSQSLPQTPINPPVRTPESTALTPIPDPPNSIPCSDHESSSFASKTPEPAPVGSASNSTKGFSFQHVSEEIKPSAQTG